VSDPTGVLSDLHINHTKYAAPTQNITNQATAVVNNISTAIENLNRDLSNLTFFGSVSARIQSDIAAGLTDMISSLSNAGLKGVSVIDSGAGKHLVVDGAALVSSLNDASRGPQFTQKIDTVVSRLQVVTAYKTTG
jgi:hypothetical protein